MLGMRGTSTSRNARTSTTIHSLLVDNKRKRESQEEKGLILLLSVEMVDGSAMKTIQKILFFGSNSVGQKRVPVATCKLQQAQLPGLA